MATRKTGRIRHLRDVFFIPIWRLVSYIVLELAGTFLTWRDLLVSPADQKKMGLDHLPHVAWGWWVALTAILIIIAMFEGSLRAVHRVELERDVALEGSNALRRREVQALERQARAAEETNRRHEYENSEAARIVRRLAEARKYRLDISFEPRRPYVIKESETELARFVSVGVTNLGEHKVTDCKVYIRDIEPPFSSHRGGDILLRQESFDLNPREPATMVQIVEGNGGAYTLAAHASGLISYPSLPMGECTFDIVAIAAESQAKKTFRLRRQDGTVTLEPFTRPSASPAPAPERRSKRGWRSQKPKGV